MTDLFDQQITESLHRSATHAAVHPGSFNDVRRRVRARRQRHVAAAVLPAVAGMAWIGMRPSASPVGPAAAPGASDSVPASSETSPDREAAPSTDVTSTSVSPGSIQAPTVCETLTTSDEPTGTLAPCLPLDGRVTVWLDRAGPALAALGFPTIAHETDKQGFTKISASDPARPSDRNITITILPGIPAVTTTYGSTQQTGSIAVKYQANDGWIYEIELADTAGGPLPTEAELLDIVTTLGS